MTADLDRKIVTVRYNLLNLPDTIQYYDGSMTVNHYLADGTRLSSVHHTVLDGVVVPVGSVCNVDTIANVTTSGSAYCQNIEYEMQADGTPAISRVFNSEGFILGLWPTSQAAYYCRDVQGNITSVWRVDAGYPYQSNFYYADGLLKNNSTSTSFQPYLYSAKELVKMHGYDCYDYGARHSQAALGRFTSPDPLAEKFYDTSPYALCHGNPVMRIDPDGMDDYGLSSDGTITLIKQTEDERDRLIAGYNSNAKNQGLKYNKKTGELKNKSIEVDKGVLDSKSTNKYGDSYTLSRVEGYDNTSLFEFCADNSDVEWTQYQVGDGERTRTFLTTSHEKYTDSNSSAKLKYVNDKSSFVLNYHYHSHPYDPEADELYNRAASTDDFIFKNDKQIRGSANPNAVYKTYLRRGNGPYFKTY